MNINKLIKMLEELRDEHGQLEVLISTDEFVTDLHWAEYSIAEKDEYPKEWKMPEGFEFIKLEAIN